MIHRLQIALVAILALATASPAGAQYYDAFGNMKTVGAAAQRTTVEGSAAQTAGGTSAAVAVGSYREFLLLLNVTAVSGTGSPTLTCFVDTSSDGGTTWFQIASGAAITATGTQIIQLGAGTAATPAVLFGDTVRLRWTITGTTPSFTFSAIGIGK